MSLNCVAAGICRPVGWVSLLTLSLAPVFLAKAFEPVTGPVPQAPPAPPPVILREPGPIRQGDGPNYGPQQLWSIGQPSDEEQLYLEYINRSRANPPAEGARLAATTDAEVQSAYSFFEVDLGLMQSQFNAITAVPPLAMSEALLIAARLHSGDMFTNEFQGHTGSTGSTLDIRVSAQDYPYTTLAENVYSYAESAWHGHAGFNVDWGPGTGGMQTPPGHRVNIHNSTVREVGIGVVNGVKGDVGPQLVTQDFGLRQGATPLVTGVVYYDFNGNQFYDVGEGIGGVTVNVPGSGYYAVTADSGGYAVPVTTNGNYAVSFAASGLGHEAVAQVLNGQNVKVDFRPVYQPPLVSGPNPAAVNQGNPYTISTVGAATGYDWMVATLGNYTAVEGAENLANVTIVSSAGYAVQATSPKHAGSYSFHLAHPQGTTGPVDQFIYLNTTLRPAANSELSFYKRLGWAGSAQVARAQVSTNSGSSWGDLWSQTGTNGIGESGFSQVKAALGAYAGAQLRIRFVYDFTGGSYYPQTDEGVGLYLDTIAVSNAGVLVGTVTNSIPSGASFTFTPTALTNYLVSARARLPGRILPWGPTVQITAAPAPPSIQLTGKPTLVGGQVQVDFAVTNYRAGMTFQLYTATSPQGPWTADTTATLQTLVPNSQFRLTTTTGSAPQTFYRVRGLY